MGRSYFVPRSVKGETRLLAIFSIKSFIYTVGIGLIGAGIWWIGSIFFGMGMIAGLIVTAAFGGVGYVLGTAKIPDSPIMGAFQKAGGEYISEILKRFITFKSRKKVYVYNYTRAKDKGGKANG